MFALENGSIRSTVYRATPTFAVNQAGDAAGAVERPSSDGKGTFVYTGEVSYRWPPRE
jgi:hypothetical protein